MNNNYLLGKADSIKARMQEVDNLIHQYQSLLNDLQKEYFYLQGSLAVVNELCDLERGGSDEKDTNQS